MHAADMPADGREPQPPVGVWVGSYAELTALDLPEPQTIGMLGEIPIVAGETVLIYGPSNLGKSLLALLVCIRAAVDGTDVLIVEAEGSKRALRDRVRRIAVGLGADLTVVGPRISIVHGGFGLAEQIELWRSTLDRARYSIVMVDPMISYFVGDENASREMQAFLDVIAIARAGGSTVIVVHHSTKPDKEGRSHERGSSALRAWADEAVSLARGERTDVIVAHEKSRERGKHPTAQVFTWTFSDTAISLATSEAADDATATAATKRHRVTLLGLLADSAEGVTATDARTALNGMGGKRFRKLILLPLLDARRIEEAEVQRRDSKGRPYRVSILRLKPLANAPAPSVGQANGQRTREAVAATAPRGLES